MRPFVSLVSDTQVPTLWRALRIRLVDLIEAAPIGIFSGSSAGVQVALRVSAVETETCVVIARAPGASAHASHLGDATAAIAPPPNTHSPNN